MIHLLILAVHLLATIAKLVRPGGVRTVMAESLLLKHQLLISNRARRRAPNLNSFDRLVLGLGSLFVPPGVDAVIWKFRVGVPWRDLPERFGGWCNTHKRFSRWAVTGVWASLFNTLADDPDNEYAMIDATIVRAHQHSAGARKKGVSTKPSAARAAGSRRKSM